MNGHGREPPDGHGSNVIALENEPILCAMEIKQEATVKQEPEVGEYFVPVSQSSRLANSVSLRNANGDEPLNYNNDDFDFNNSAEIKMDEKVEKVKKEDKKQVACNSADKKENSQRNSVKSSLKVGVGEVGNKHRANGVREAKKPPEAKAKGKRHKCSLCAYVTAKRNHLNQHMLTHTGEKPFPCTICPKRFTQQQSLQSHMITHVDDFLFNCSTCLQGFHRSDEKIEHEADCNVRRYECYVCKKFSTFYKKNLEIHLRVHTGERPFECDQCSQKFAQANTLNAHRKTHANPRPLKFKCSVCFKNFAQQMEKENHEANCMRRGYECDVCKTYTTDSKGNLMRHMCTHTGEKPFQCAKCSKCFMSKANLNRHQKTHK